MKKLKYFIPTILVMIFIFFMSAQDATLSSHESSRIVDFIYSLLHLPLEYYDIITTVVRKIGHLSEYALLGITLYYGCYKNSVLQIYYPLIVGALYACSDEFHQLFVAGRSGEIRDVCIDSIGVIMGVIILYIIKKRNHRC